MICTLSGACDTICVGVWSCRKSTWPRFCSPFSPPSHRGLNTKQSVVETLSYDKMRPRTGVIGRCATRKTFFIYLFIFLEATTLCRSYSRINGRLNGQISTRTRAWIRIPPPHAHEKYIWNPNWHRCVFWMESSGRMCVGNAAFLLTFGLWWVWKFLEWGMFRLRNRSFLWLNGASSQKEHFVFWWCSVRPTTQMAQFFFAHASGMPKSYLNF